MALKSNIHYWQTSLQNPEPYSDPHYIYSKVIIQDEELTGAVSQLRELIVSYCVLKELEYEGRELAEDAIVREINRILTSHQCLQYTEFVAFWKCLDMSFSIYRKLSPQEQLTLLRKSLENYCRNRIDLYKTHGLTHSVVQALYDAQSSRKQGSSAIRKLVALLSEASPQIRKLEENLVLSESSLWYAILDRSEGKKILEQIISSRSLKFTFRIQKQNKLPDLVVGVEKHVFLLEAKHIKEPGGAQDKQIAELIDFIRECETDSTFHYVSFLDGLYFNELIRENSGDKQAFQKRAILECLKNCPSNYFVNTAGFKALLQDAVEELTLR